MSINRFGEVVDGDGGGEKDGGITPLYSEPKKTHVVMINGGYTGPLRKGFSQFSFGNYHHPHQSLVFSEHEFRNIPVNDFLIGGFIVPHSGKIKKIKMVNPFSSKMSFDLTKAIIKKPDDHFKNGFFAIIKNVETIGVITYSKEYEIPLSDEIVRAFTDFCFDDDLPLEKLKVEEGDVINIRSLVDVDVPSLSASQLLEMEKTLPVSFKEIAKRLRTEGLAPDFFIFYTSKYLVSI